MTTYNGKTFAHLVTEEAVLATPLPNYASDAVQQKRICTKCGGTHPAFIPCRGPIAPPRPAGHNPKA